MSKVQLSNVRTAFMNVFEPQAMEGGAAKYSSAFILDPKAPYIAVLDAAIAAVAKEKWKEEAPKILKKLTSEGRVCFKKEPRTNANGDVYAGFEGAYSLNATNASRPLVLDRDKTPLTKADGKPYSGCYVNASIELWAQDNQYGRRINATLRGVQFVKDGDAFGGGSPASADEFEDLAATADDLV
jgi:hypothetical protein